MHPARRKVIGRNYGETYEENYGVRGSLFGTGLDKVVSNGNASRLAPVGRAQLAEQVGNVG
jgi:hypothetical protein